MHKILALNVGLLCSQWIIDVLKVRKCTPAFFQEFFHNFYCSGPKLSFCGGGGSLSMVANGLKEASPLPWKKASTYHFKSCLYGYIINQINFKSYFTKLS